MARHISKEQFISFKEGFYLFFKDGDLAITTKLLGTVLRSLGYSLTEAELQCKISEIDANGSGTVDFPEFLSLMEERTRESDSKDETFVSFRVIDKDDDGCMSAVELQYIINNFGQWQTDKEVDEMIMDASIDEDGRENCELVVRVMMEK